MAFWQSSFTLEVLPRNLERQKRPLSSLSASKTIPEVPLNASVGHALHESLPERCMQRNRCRGVGVLMPFDTLLLFAISLLRCPSEPPGTRSDGDCLWEAWALSGEVDHLMLPLRP